MHTGHIPTLDSASEGWAQGIKIMAYGPECSCEAARVAAGSVSLSPDSPGSHIHIDSIKEAALFVRGSFPTVSVSTASGSAVHIHTGELWLLQTKYRHRPVPVFMICSLFSAWMACGYDLSRIPSFFVLHSAGCTRCCSSSHVLRPLNPTVRTLAWVLRMP